MVCVNYDSFLTHSCLGTRLGRFFGIPKNIRVFFQNRFFGFTENRKTWKNTKYRGKKGANTANLKPANSSWLFIHAIIRNGRNQWNVLLVRVFIFRFWLRLHFKTRSYFKPLLFRFPNSEELFYVDVEMPESNSSVWKFFKVGEGW